MVSSKALNFSLSIFFCFFLNVTLEKIRTLVEEENIYAKIGKPITINCLFKDFKIDSLTEKNHKFSWFWKKEKTSELKEIFQNNSSLFPDANITVSQNQTVLSINSYLKIMDGIFVCVYGFVIKYEKIINLFELDQRSNISPKSCSTDLKMTAINCEFSESFDFFESFAYYCEFEMLHPSAIKCKGRINMCNDKELNSITIKNGTPTCELMNGHLHPLLVSSYPKEVLVHIVPKDKRSECTNCSSLQKVIFKIDEPQGLTFEPVHCNSTCMADNKKVPTCMNEPGRYAGVHIYSGLISRAFDLKITTWYKYGHDGKYEYMEQQKSETIEVTICFLDFATNYTFHYGMKAGNDSLVEWRSWEDTQVVTTVNEMHRDQPGVNNRVPNEPNQKTNKSLKIEYIIGIAVGVFIVLSLLIVGLVKCHLVRRAKRKEKMRKREEVLALLPQEQVLQRETKH